ncbi:hypothetical protein [Giesbergeria anulus]|uniref:Uncharacterized protein n=1 Tax=Giesbergeria anulus TaxID=180197 RepID=A0A1H9RN39_9BURK|nr:hypothetical protein [Giesbergeria anulus]SER74037.1 hypothetical protein SAMN02982919_02931 [Giesbergeria anulus]
MTKDVHGFQKDERTYQDGAPDRQTKTLQAQQAVRTAQLYDAYQNATDPKQQAAIAERLRVLTGKDKPEAWKATALSGGKDALGNPQPGGALILNPTTGEHRYVQGGEQGGQPLPPKNQLVKGQVYQTGRGNMRWNGAGFDPA